MTAKRKKSKKKKQQTPIRKGLKKSSSLQQSTKAGMEAVQRAHRQLFDTEIRDQFGDSLDLDAAMQAQHPQSNRWDYLLGHTPSKRIVAVEPHSAKQDEISTVIRKRESARQHLASHLKPGARVQKWLWVASGKVQFADTEKARLRLDQSGIEFVNEMILAKHLPAEEETTRRRRK